MFLKLWEGKEYNKSKAYVILWKWAKYHRKQHIPSSVATLQRQRLSWDCTIFCCAFMQLRRLKID